MKLIVIVVAITFAVIMGKTHHKEQRLRKLSINESEMSRMFDPNYYLSDRPDSLYAMK